MQRTWRRASCSSAQRQLTSLFRVRGLYANDLLLATGGLDDHNDVLSLLIGIQDITRQLFVVLGRLTLLYDSRQIQVVLGCAAFIQQAPLASIPVRHEQLVLGAL